MNIIQLIERVKFLIDHVSSPRFSSDRYVEAINSVTDRIVEDRYGVIKNKRGYSFESIQRVRDELYTIVKDSSSITASGSVLSAASFPADYKYLLDINVVIDGVTYNCEPLTYDEKPTLSKNPFRRPKLTYPSKVYYIESENGVTINYGDSGTLASGILTYLAAPVSVVYGTERDSTYTAPADISVIAIATTVYSGTTYNIGTEFMLANGDSITSGTVVSGYTDSDLPNTLHEEIAKLTASLLKKTVDDYNKGIILEKEAEKT